MIFHDLMMNYNKSQPENWPNLQLRRFVAATPRPGDPCAWRVAMDGTVPGSSWAAGPCGGWIKAGSIIQQW